MTTMTWAAHPILELNDYLKPGRTAWGEEYQNSPNANGYECCLACGRRTVEGRGYTVILGLGGSRLIHPDDEQAAEQHDLGYMGVWMVGPECGKRIPKEYRVVTEVAR